MVLQHFDGVAVVPCRAEHVYATAFHRWPRLHRVPADFHRAFTTKIAGARAQGECLEVAREEDVPLERDDDVTQVFLLAGFESTMHQQCLFVAVDQFPGLAIVGRVGRATEAAVVAVAAVFALPADPGAGHDRVGFYDLSIVSAERDCPLDEFLIACHADQRIK